MTTTTMMMAAAAAATTTIAATARQQRPNLVNVVPYEKCTQMQATLQSEVPFNWYPKWASTHAQIYWLKRCHSLVTSSHLLTYTVVVFGGVVVVGVIVVIFVCIYCSCTCFICAAGAVAVTAGYWLLVLLLLLTKLFAELKNTAQTYVCGFYLWTILSAGGEPVPMYLYVLVYLSLRVYVCFHAFANVYVSRYTWTWIDLCRWVLVFFLSFLFLFSTCNVRVLVCFFSSKYFFFKYIFVQIL